MVLMMVFPSVVVAKENCGGECSACHTLSVKEAAEFTKALGVTVKSVAHSPMGGMFEVRAERDGKEGLIFVDFGKRYLMQGVMVKIDDLKTADLKKGPVGKSTDMEVASRLLRMNSIVMGNPKAAKQLVVFTDPDCPFCSRLHGELKKLVAEMDVAVYVKMYPLPSHPDAYRKARVILGKHSLELLDKAFSGERIPAPSDSDKGEPVDDTIELAKSLGIKGAPAILLPNGKIEVGYKDAATLKKLILSGP